MPGKKSPERRRRQKERRRANAAAMQRGSLALAADAARLAAARKAETILAGRSVIPCELCEAPVPAARPRLRVRCDDCRRAPGPRRERPEAAPRALTLDRTIRRALADRD